MSTLLSPLVSEFETTAKEAQYKAWLIAKTTISAADTSPCIAHDAVMAEIEAIISEAEYRKSS